MCLQDIVLDELTQRRKLSQQLQEMELRVFQEMGACFSIANIYWNVYGKVDSVVRIGSSKLSDLEFHYDPMGNRTCKIVKPRVQATPNTTPATYVRSTQDQWTYTYYVHAASSTPVYAQNFDAWGRPRSAGDWSYNNDASAPPWLVRGYTGHEMMPEFGLINMNARLYDPVLGRMLGPDVNSDVSNSQGMNRFTYANNNPLKYTDPTGNLPNGGSALDKAAARDFQLQGVVNRSVEDNLIWISSFSGTNIPSWTTNYLGLIQMFGMAGGGGPINDNYSGPMSSSQTNGYNVPTVFASLDAVLADPSGKVIGYQEVQGYVVQNWSIDIGGYVKEGISYFMTTELQPIYATTASNAQGGGGGAKWRWLGT